MHNSFFAKHFSLTAFDLYNSHLDDSGLEYTFLLRNIFCANEEANFPASPLFFSEFNKVGPYFMTGNYSPPTNFISSSKANFLGKHVASVKSLKLEVPVEINTSC